MQIKDYKCKCGHIDFIICDTSTWESAAIGIIDQKEKAHE